MGLHAGRKGLANFFGTYSKDEVSDADKHNTQRPRRDSNSQSSDPKSDALSIRPRGLPHVLFFSLCCVEQPHS